MNINASPKFLSTNGTRADHRIITGWVKPGSRILDLGCGNGDLLALLQAEKQCKGYGIDIDDAHVVNAVENGINVIQSDLNDGIAEFEDNSFDYVILSLTLQAMRHPDTLVNEMLRVGTEGVVSIPNFGHWRARIQLALTGRMPVTQALPHSWYDTPNIHLCTLKDFEKFCTDHKMRVLERHTVQNVPGLLSRIMPTLFANIALYRFSR